MDMFPFQKRIHFVICQLCCWEFMNGKYENGYLPWMYPFCNLPALLLKLCQWQIWKWKRFFQRIPFEICLLCCWNCVDGKYENWSVLWMYQFCNVPGFWTGIKMANMKMEMFLERIHFVICQLCCWNCVDGKYESWSVLWTYQFCNLPGFWTGIKMANMNMDMFPFQKRIHFVICQLCCWEFMNGKYENGYLPWMYPFCNLPALLLKLCQWQIWKWKRFFQRIHFVICALVKN